MRKYFLSFVALAAGLFATSCQESLVEPQVGGPTTFTVQLPDAMGTKAEIGSANTVNQLFVSVYTPGCESTPLSSAVVEKTEGDGTFTVSFNLIQDQTYDLIFWAQTTNAYVDKSSEDALYDLRKIDISERFYSSENGAAFYAYQTYVIDGQPKEATLRRPFAQLNIGTTVESLKTDADSDIILEGANIEVRNVASLFNTVTGFGEGTATIYGETDLFVKVAGEDIQVNNNQKYAKLDVGGKSYVYVTMDYLPIISSETDPKDLVEIKLLIDTDQPTTIEHTFSSVPVQRNYRTNIVGNLISSSTDFNVVVDERFVDENGDNVSDDNNILVVENAAAAQAALDNAKPGDVIELVAGVNYGTLLIRPVEGKENTITDCDYLVYSNEMRRDVKDLTIIGAPGAKVDAIKTVAGYIEGSGSTGYVVNIENLVINSVEFTDKHTNAPHSYASPIFFDLSYINVNGLTVKNCKLIGNNDKMNFVYFYGSGKPDNSTFETAAKNVIIENNTVDGIARLCELRQTENVIITGNTIKNTSLHGMLLTVDKGTYSGDVTITDNTADGIHNRFVRMAGAGDAEVVIKDNYIYNYQGADADYIKVTGSNDETNLVTIENNQRGYYVTPETLSSTNFNDGGIFYLKGDFSEVLSINITPTEGVVATIDASEAEFGDIIKLMIPSQPDNNNVISRELGRKGNYTFNGFKGTTVGLGAYGTNVTITNSELDAIDVYAANISLDINNNKIDSEYKMHPRVAGGETDYAAYLMMISYDLKFDHNIVSNPIGHAVAINGLVATFDGDLSEINNPAWASKVSSYTNNTINGIGGSTKNNRAGFKVWDDLTYAPTNVNQFELLPPAGQGLINYVESNLAQNKFVKAESTSNSAYKICFYEYYHELLN